MLMHHFNFAIRPPHTRSNGEAFVHLVRSGVSVNLTFVTLWELGNMELAVRSLQIGYFIKDWRNMWSFLNHIAPLQFSADLPKASSRNSPRHEASVPSSFCPHLLEFKIHPSFSRKIVNKSHVSFNTPPPPRLFFSTNK